MQRYAISDIHGCSQTFEALLDQMSPGSGDELYLLGDYIDRGPDSKAVIDRILGLRESGYGVHCLRGNHEQILLDAIDEPGQLQVFLNNGGWETVGSFGVDHPSEIPEPYLFFFKTLQFYLDIPGYLLVHAGLNFRLENPLSSGKSMIWIRQWYQDIRVDWLDGRIIVHGHTPIGQAAISGMAEQLQERRVLNIDAGCVYTGYPGMGHLCGFNLDTGQLYFQSNRDSA